MHEILNLNLNVIIVNKKKKVLLVFKVHILGRYERQDWVEDLEIMDE